MIRVENYPLIRRQKTMSGRSAADADKPSSSTDTSPAESDSSSAAANNDPEGQPQSSSEKKKQKRKSTSAPLASAPPSAQSSTSTSDVRSRLECVCCFNIMLPPIRQCAEGHNFCDKCSSRLMTGAVPSSRKCPTCRIPLSNPVARARNLEQWASEVDVEVTCDLDGCGACFRYSQFSEHQRTCLGRTVPCPKRCCTWRGEPAMLGAHLQSEHKLCPVSIPAKFSQRHADYSTTVIFQTNRQVGDKRRWRPPRQLIVVPPNVNLGIQKQVTFVVALWKAKGKGEPFVAAIQALRKSGNDEIPFSFDLSLSAYPRPPTTLCVSRASAVGPVSELDAMEVWKRPRLAKVRSPVLVADKASMAIFNTAQLDVNDTSSIQRYELHVRLLPLIQAGMDPNGPNPVVDPEYEHYDHRANNGEGSSGHDGSDSDEDYSDEEDVVNIRESENSSSSDVSSDDSSGSSSSDDGREDDEEDADEHQNHRERRRERRRRHRDRDRTIEVVEVDELDDDGDDDDDSEPRNRRRDHERNWDRNRGRRGRRSREHAIEVVEVNDSADDSDGSSSGSESESQGSSADSDSDSESGSGDSDSGSSSS